MKSLKFAARRGAIISVTALSALALASCSAGQITQTSDKVVAVDGANATTEDEQVAVQDVTILLEPGSATAALKFSAINKGYSSDQVTLEAIDVDGQPVAVAGAPAIGRDQSIIGNSAENLQNLPKQDGRAYLATTLRNDDFAYSGTRPVTFTFSNGTVQVDAPVSASPLKSGKYNRDAQSTDGYTTKAPEAHSH
ncbi:hypothetical protein G7Y31_01770 [Corynebacterium lizhenjunii]|uniref:Lipoprotein LpqE n=1 Tax=Corynebacterium lizhenjunii TaxID=2709394 RepID=A0A7T0KFQ2_9CORY|nr:hypothetical protein [Corynebacterium lizhenjunii]QPK79465.1 hypothetical protein G7Y31_01770 [Corynebacterium lizhenjunii]